MDGLVGLWPQGLLYAFSNPTGGIDQGGDDGVRVPAVASDWSLQPWMATLKKSERLSCF